MFIKKLKLLTMSDYLKVSIPLILLLGVFFSSSMIESSIEKMFRNRLPDVQSMTMDNVDKQDSEFIKAILNEQNIEDINPFLLSAYLKNGFISGLYNEVVTEIPVMQEQPTGQIPVQMAEIPVYRVTAISSGNLRQFAVVNSSIVQAGDIMSNGDTVMAISGRGVLIEGQWGRQWFYVVY